MAGTLFIAKGMSFDIRTIDFERIADALRNRAQKTDVVKKTLQSMDEYGMDMICADELNSLEFKEFCALLNDIRIDLVDSHGVPAFIDMVLQAAETDARSRA